MNGTRLAAKQARERLRKHGGVIVWKLDGPMGVLELWQLGERRLLLQVLPDPQVGIEIWAPIAARGLDDLLHKAVPDEADAEQVGAFGVVGGQE